MFNKTICLHLGKKKLQNMSQISPCEFWELSVAVIMRTSHYKHLFSFSHKRNLIMCQIQIALDSILLLVLLLVSEQAVCCVTGFKDPACHAQNII